MSLARFSSAIAIQSDLNIEPDKSADIYTTVYNAHKIFQLLQCLESRESGRGEMKRQS